MSSRYVYHGVIYSKKNSKQIITNRRTGKPQIISNARALNMERDMIMQFREQDRLKTLKTPLNGNKYSVHIVIYEPDHRRRDLDNQMTSLLDALVAAGVLTDDSCDYVTRLSVELGGYDKQDPRAEIEVEYGALS